MLSAILLFVAFSTTDNAFAGKNDEIRVKREFTALVFPSVTVKHVLSYIQSQRGGTITPDDDVEGKWRLRDSTGLKWNAEVDGRFSSSDGVKNVMEVKTPYLKDKDEHLAVLPLNALLALGAEPMYSVGGGHFHIKLPPFLAQPSRFASLVNFLLNYEDLLVYIFSNPQRLGTTRKLSETRIEGNRKPLSQILGESLNEALNKQDPQFVLKTLENFAINVVPTREMDINLRSWKGSGSKKTHNTIELRFFNAPKTEQEAILEEVLVRTIAHKCLESASLVYYQPLIKPGNGEWDYLEDPAKIENDFRQLLTELKLDPKPYFAAHIERLSERRHPGK